MYAVNRVWLLTKATVSIVGAVIVLAYAVVQHQSKAAVEQVVVEAKQWAGDAEKGQYIARMSGCIACHTDYVGGGRELAGGREIQTPFGIFYSPNITSDAATGLGKWTQNEFLAAVKVGVSPEGAHYSPAFPYTAYNRLSTEDVVHLWAWISSVTPVENAVTEHKVSPVVVSELSLSLWQALYFNAESTWRSENRGDYLVNAAGHCFECHAQRSVLGGIRNTALSGNSRGPNGQTVPGITAGDLDGWSQEDLAFFLEIGMTPEGDFTGGSMTEVIEHSTALLTAEDRTQIAEYLKSSRNTP